MPREGRILELPCGRTSCDKCNYDFIDRKVYES
jgi:hypothetical protein